METKKESVFAQVLFEKYEESMKCLHAAQAAHEQRLLADEENDKLRAERETEAYERGLAFGHEQARNVGRDPRESISGDAS